MGKKNNEKEVERLTQRLKEAEEKVFKDIMDFSEQLIEENGKLRFLIVLLTGLCLISVSFNIAFLI